MNDLIVVSDVSKSWGSNLAVRPVNLTVGDGEVVALLGGPRSGKSTLLKIISADVKPDTGSVLVCGYDTVMQAGMVRPRIGVVHHEHFLEPELSGNENLAEQALLRFLSDTDAQARIAELLPLCALGARLDDPAKSYRPEEWMALEMAACLIHRPQLLLVDEPTRGADAAGRERVWTALRAMRPQVRSLLFTTADAAEAQALADRVVRL